MSQADILLDKLSEISETEEHIVIGRDRYITVPEALWRIAVQYDHNIERVTFDCPRYWDDNDMSIMNIYINYKLPDNTYGFCIAENVTIDENDPDIIHFDWVISRDVTSVVGQLVFLVCAKTVDEDGNEDIHWNSEINTEMFISEGMECAEPILKQYPDVVTQLLSISETLKNHYENGDFELGLPIVDESDNGRILRVENGQWCADELRVYEGGYIEETNNSSDIYTMEQTANLFNKDSEDNVLGYLLHQNETTAISNWAYSHYIDVEEGARYCFYNYNGGLSMSSYYPSFYDASGAFIRTTAAQQSVETIGEWTYFTVPLGLGIAKMRVSYATKNGADSYMMVVKGDTAPEEYIPYGEAPKLTEKMAAMVAEEAEKATNETINKYHQERDINPNNLFANPIFNGSDKWTLSSTGATIVETDTIVNGLELVASGGSATFRQDISTSGLQSGRYVIRCKSTTVNLSCAVQVFGNGSGKTIREDALIRNGDICEAEFDIDFEALLEEIPSLYLLRIGFYQYYSTPTVVSEPYFGLSEGEYTGFWNVAYGDAVRRKEFTDLKTVVDAQAEAANPLYGKIITFNGDSICEARATNGGGYATIIGANNNMTVENLGVSGGTIMYAEGKHCISRTVANMREDADYIILEGGVNDLYSDRPLGAMSNGYNATLDDTTFYGAFENMLKQALIRFHGKKIGYIAVHKMTTYFDSDQTEDNAYHAAIKCCAKWGIPVCDLNVSCPPFAYLKNNADTAFMANLYTEDTSGTGVGDGWHPNEEGYRKFYVPKIEAWLKTL